MRDRRLSGRWLSSDRILGIVGGAMVGAALILLVVGGPADAGTETGAPPAIEVIAPRAGEVVTLPLQLRFWTAEALGRGPGGWGTGDFHLHAAIDGLEVMPGPADIQVAGDGSYVWTLPGLQSGDTEIRLFWSDAAHRPIEGSSGSPFAVRLQSADPPDGGAPE